MAAVTATSTQNFAIKKWSNTSSNSGVAVHSGDLMMTWQMKIMLRATNSFMKHNQSFESIYYNDVDSHFLIAMFLVDVAVTAANCSPFLRAHSSSISPSSLSSAMTW